MVYCSIYLFLSWFVGLVNATMAVQKKKEKEKKELNQEKRIKLFDYLIMGFSSSVKTHRKGVLRSQSLGNGEG